MGKGGEATCAKGVGVGAGAGAGAGVGVGAGARAPPRLKVLGTCDAHCNVGSSIDDDNSNVEDTYADSCAMVTHGACPVVVDLSNMVEADMSTGRQRAVRRLQSRRWVGACCVSSVFPEQVWLTPWPCALLAVFPFLRFGSRRLLTSSSMRLPAARQSLMVCKRCSARRCLQHMSCPSLGTLDWL